MSVRLDLVDAGVRLLERDGLSRLSLRRIAAEAGVSHGAPRRYFPTYDGLLAAVARVGVEDLDRQLTPALEARDAREALRGAATTYVEFARRRPEMFELLGRHDLLDGAGGRLREITAGWFALLAERARELGGGEHQVFALWSGVHGLAVVVSRRTAEAVTEAPPVGAVVDTLLDGLLGRG